MIYINNNTGKSLFEILVIEILLYNRNNTQHAARNRSGGFGKLWP